MAIRILKIVLVVFVGLQGWLLWQTQVGTGSFEGAFVYGATSALVLLFVNSPDP